MRFFGLLALVPVATAFAPAAHRAPRFGRRTTVSAKAVAAGSKLPPISLDYNFPPVKVNLAQRCASKNVILVGLPGAFTPT